MDHFQSASDDSSGSENEANDLGNTNPNPYEITLVSGQLYIFSCECIGRLPIRGGSMSDAIIDGCQVSIRNVADGTQLFSEGGDNDRIIITNDSASLTTVIKHIPGGATADPQQQEDEPFKAVAVPEYHIRVTGDRDVLITGDGGYLKVRERGNVEFRGNPQGVSHKGNGNVLITGNVLGRTANKGKGHLTVNGYVIGSISQRRGGTIEIRAQDSLVLEAVHAMLMNGNTTTTTTPCEAE